jgi:hypothetical protein
MEPVRLPKVPGRRFARPVASEARRITDAASAAFLFIRDRPGGMDSGLDKAVLI